MARLNMGRAVRKATEFISKLDNMDQIDDVKSKLLEPQILLDRHVANNRGISGRAGSTNDRDDFLDQDEDL